MPWGMASWDLAARAAVQVCREAGARVASNVMLRDMNLDVPLADARRTEVLANGLPCKLPLTRLS